MNKSLESFYNQKFDELPSLPPVGIGDFNVFLYRKRMEGESQLHILVMTFLK